MGVYLIHQNDVEKYLKKFSPVQLRYNKKTNINNNYRYYNFGESKGLEFDRVIIYPTKGILEWLEIGKKLEDKTKCAFYVAITRTKYSVVIIYEKELFNIPLLSNIPKNIID